MKSLRKILTGALIASSLLAGSVDAKGWAKATSQHDIRDYSTVTLTGGASELPFGTGMFGFVESETEGNSGNLKLPYSEINISKKGPNGLGVIAEYNRSFEADQGVGRVGLVYEPKLPFFLGTKFHPFSTRKNGMQLGVYGNKKLDDEYIEGFVDYNFKPGKFVGEVQAGKRIGGNLFGVVEGRYNGFRDDDLGLGIGLEWKL